MVGLQAAVTEISKARDAFRERSISYAEPLLDLYKRKASSIGEAKRPMPPERLLAFVRYLNIIAEKEEMLGRSEDARTSRNRAYEELTEGIRHIDSRLTEVVAEVMSPNALKNQHRLDAQNLDTLLKHAVRLRGRAGEIKFRMGEVGEAFAIARQMSEAYAKYRMMGFGESLTMDFAGMIMKPNGMVANLAAGNAERDKKIYGIALEACIEAAKSIENGLFSMVHNEKMMVPEPPEDISTTLTVYAAQFAIR
ncbi:MAG: hypothetical protein KGH62_03560, partial [Candidatus Micrarchaeota archaeon]|nr:hypothetical protein [Candidatus Micrarchaeota archaeon]